MRTVTKTGMAEHKVKGSKHLGFAHGVTSKSEVQEILQQYRRDHPKANHVCHAYILDKNEMLSNDDGEPKNSAGPPILGQIRSFSLVYSMVVVIRYFGGTKLGVPGLIQAYKTTAELALKNAMLDEHYEVLALQITFDYPHEAQVNRIIDQSQSEIVERFFSEQIRFTLEVRKDAYAATEKKLKVYCSELIKL